jgi:ABC-2 type transport system ATP-binding protein
VELDRGRVALDDRVAGAGELGERLACRVVLRGAEETVVASLASWGLRRTEPGCSFEGDLAGPDRLRFLGMLARHSGRIAELHLAPAGSEEEPPAGSNEEDGS